MMGVTFTVSHSVMSDSYDPINCSLPGSSVQGGKNSGVSSHFLLQGIFPTQGSNPGLLPNRQILYHLSYQGSPPYHYLKVSKFGTVDGFDIKCKKKRKVGIPRYLLFFFFKLKVCIYHLLRLDIFRGEGFLVGWPELYSGMLDMNWLYSLLQIPWHQLLPKKQLFA